MKPVLPCLIMYETRLPSNPRPITRKCVNSSTRGHFRSREKDGGDTSFDPPYPKTPRCTQTSRLYVLQKRSYCRSKFYIAGIGVFGYFCSRDLDVDPIADPNLTRIHWRCTGWAKCIIWQTYRVDRHDRNYTPHRLRQWSNILAHKSNSFWVNSVETGS